MQFSILLLIEANMKLEGGANFQNSQAPALCVLCIIMIKGGIFVVCAMVQLPLSAQWSNWRITKYFMNLIYNHSTTARNDKVRD